MTDLGRLLGALMLALALQACGLKGPLYLEEPTEEPPPSVQLPDTETEDEAELTENPDTEEVDVGDGVPAMETVPESP